jgi:hypothetical protein
MTAGRPADPDSFLAMLEAVQAFHLKHRFRELGGEEMTYRISLMAEELGRYPPASPKARRRMSWPRRSLTS